MESVDQERARMRSEEGRLRELKRKKIRKRRIVKALLIVGFCLIIGLGAFAAVYLMGVFEKRSDENLLTLSEKGSVTFEELSPTKDSGFDKNELKSYIKDQISSYNSGNGGSVKLERYAWNDDKVYVRTAYRSCGEYSDFTGYFIYSGDLVGAIDEGVDMTAGIRLVKDGKISETDAASSDMDGKKILVIRENTAVKVPGKIVAVSWAGTELLSSDTVRISSVSSEDDAALPTVIVYE